MRVDQAAGSVGLIGVVALTLYAIGRLEDNEGRIVGLRLATTMSAAEGCDIHRSAVVSRIGGKTPSWIVETAYFDPRARDWVGSRIRVCGGKWLRTDAVERSSDKLDEIPVARFSGTFDSPEELAEQVSPP